MTHSWLVFLFRVREVSSSISCKDFKSYGVDPEYCENGDYDWEQNLLVKAGIWCADHTLLELKVI